MVGKLWEFFVYDSSLQGRASDALAATFRKADYRIAPLLARDLPEPVSSTPRPRSARRSSPDAVPHPDAQAARNQPSRPPVSPSPPSSSSDRCCSCRPTSPAGTGARRGSTPTPCSPATTSPASSPRVRKGGQRAGNGTRRESGRMMAGTRRAETRRPRLDGPGLRENRAASAARKSRRTGRRAHLPLLPRTGARKGPRGSFIEYAIAKKGVIFTNKETAELCHLMLSTPYYQLC
jgi:hypothetical protein